MEPKDPYYLFLKRTGCMDFIDDIVKPGEVEGMRVDTDYIYSPTVCVVDKITANNLNYILRSIGFSRL